MSYLARLFFDIFPEYNRSVDLRLYCLYKSTVFLFICYHIRPYGLYTLYLLVYKITRVVRRVLIGDAKRRFAVDDIDLYFEIQTYVQLSYTLIFEYFIFFS